MRLFYYAFKIICDPVFKSQVLVLLKKINNKLSLNGSTIKESIFIMFNDIKYFNRLFLNSGLRKIYTL